MYIRLFIEYIVVSVSEKVRLKAFNHNSLSSFQMENHVKNICKERQKDCEFKNIGCTFKVYKVYSILSWQSFLLLCGNQSQGN